MGHKGDIEARYTTNKGRLSDEMVADMRRAFLQSQEFLCTDQNNNVNSQTKKEMFLEMWREQAKMYGIDPDKLQVAEKQRSTRKDDEISIIKDAITEKISHKEKQKQQLQTKLVKGEEELLLCMNDGCNLIKELTGNRFLVSIRH